MIDRPTVPTRLFGARPDRALETTARRGVPYAVDDDSADNTPRSFPNGRPGIHN